MSLLQVTLIFNYAYNDYPDAASRIAQFDDVSRPLTRLSRLEMICSLPSDNQDLAMKTKTLSDSAQRIPVAVHQIHNP